MVKSPVICAALVVLILALLSLPAAAAVSYASSTPQIITRGDAFSLTGSITNPGPVAVWIIGRGYIDSQVVIPDEKGKFAFKLSGRETQQLPAGQYAIVVQDPGPNGLLDVEFHESPNGNITLLYRGKTFADIGSRENIRTTVVPALIALSSAETPNADDIFTSDYFLVEEPMVFFDQVTSPADNRLLAQVSGNPIIFTGTTNLGVQDTLSAAVHNTGSDAVVTSKRIPITAGSDLNHWSYTLDSPGLPVGEYLLTVGPADPPATGISSAVFSVTKNAVVNPTLTAAPGVARTPQWFDPTVPLFVVVCMLIVLGLIAFATWRR